ncbi:MAG TPA: hypothetical protein VK053_04055 [Jiangellaceae bacterium]|nr:hypothetical protein [Jiangellaceae bacterium]
MSGDLKLDTGELRETGSALRVIATEFENANANSDTAADAVGHSRLADRVREFAHNWDDTRGDMVEGIGVLADSATGVGEAFEEIETELVAALKGE